MDLQNKPQRDIAERNVKSMKKLFLCFMIMCFALLSACSNNDSRIQQIRARNNGAGELRVGVKMDVPGFGYLNPQTRELEGLEIDLAHAIAEMMLGRKNVVQFVPTTGMTKEALLTNEKVDLVIGTYTITEERRNIVNFSRPYYTDEIGFLVLKDSEIRKIDDFSGKTVGVTRASTAFSAFDNNPKLIGGNATLQAYASYPEILNALLNGNIDVFSADKSILTGYRNDKTVMLGDGIQPQPYGIGSILSDKVFAKEVDRMLGKLIEDGTLSKILAKWLSSPTKN